MANTREIRRRIRSVKNTSQITKAMQMVAATKMRKAQLQAENGRPYTQTLIESMFRLSQKVDSELNQLFQENEAKNIGVIVLSTDKGLVGALNTNITRAITQFINNPRHPRPDRGSMSDTDKMDSRVRGNDNVVFYTIGKKGRQFLVKVGKELSADFENPETVTFRAARQLGNLIIKSFLEKQIKEAYIIYPHFTSALRQEPKVQKLLPIDASEITKESETSTPRDNRDTTEFLFEPNPSELLDYILTHSVETKIYQALLETKASEHSARMITMQNATDNAKELVSDLTLAYNQTRQDAITRELLEITTAGLALE